jgi:hypothetical protein
MLEGLPAKGQAPTRLTGKPLQHGHGRRVRVRCEDAAWGACLPLRMLWSGGLSGRGHPHTGCRVEMWERQSGSWLGITLEPYN